MQSYLSGTYATLITEGGDEAKEQMKRRIARYLQDNRMAVDGMTQSELVDALYTEMAEYGFLTKYIFARRHRGDRHQFLARHRDSVYRRPNRQAGGTLRLPGPCGNVIRRMLQNSGKVLDNASPSSPPSGQEHPCFVIKTPGAGARTRASRASIRIVNPKNLTKEDFVGSGTATEKC